MSSLQVAGQAASVQLNQEGLAELAKTLPIHKRGEDQLVREGAQVRVGRPQGRGAPVPAVVESAHRDLDPSPRSPGASGRPTLVPEPHEGLAVPPTEACCAPRSPRR